jgi:glycosyltransferase involved in cell wall biosynthesis
MKKLSIIIPCFNEKNTIEKILSKISSLNIPEWEKEIIIVDDNSTDGTREILKRYENTFIIIYHEKNRGKGSGVKTGLQKSTGDYILIQDADLEYNPEEIPSLLVKLTNDPKVVVYGSRNLQNKDRKMMMIPRLGVWLITKEFNLLFGTKLTDLWTCYKIFPKSSKNFFENGGFESELSFSAKLIKNGYAIIESPISHKPRLFDEGKKIKYTDGIKGIITIAKEKFFR